MVGTLIPAALGVMLRGMVRDERVGWPSVSLLTVSLLGALFLVPAMIASDFHDKQVFRVTHFSIFNNILNGFYPPRDLVFPEHPLQYHYGVDMAAAVVAALFRARIDVAFDVVTFLGFGYSMAVFGGIGRAVLGKRAQVLTAVVCGFHGGFPWLYGNPNEVFESWIMGLYHAVQGKWLATPSTSTVFQMPFSLGYPLFAMALLVATEISSRRRNLYPAIVLALVLSAASFSNITVFLTVTGSLLIYFIFLFLKAVVCRSPGGKVRNLIAPFGGLAGALLVACLVSGFSDIVLKTGGEVIVRSPGGITGDLYNNLKWNWGSFGFLLVGAIFGLLFMPSLKVFLIVHVLGCLYIVNAYRYNYTWDMVKFGFVADVSLALLSAATIFKLWTGGFFRKVVALMLALAIAAPALAFHVPYWRDPPPSEPIFQSVVKGVWQHVLGVMVNSPDIRVISWLRPRVGEQEIVLRRSPNAELYSFMGGLPVFQPDILTVNFNNSPERIKRRKEMMSKPSEDMNEYEREGVRWAVVDTNPSSEDPLLPLVSKCAAQGRCREEVAIGSLVIFKVAP
jgi:hypothetical protein